MSPMWLTSNTPTPPRTARCSHIRLPLHGYSTGISQPPKLTILAPRRLCSAFRAVLRRPELAGEFPESIPFAQVKTDVSMHSTNGQKSRVVIMCAPMVRPFTFALCGALVPVFLAWAYFARVQQANRSIPIWRSGLGWTGFTLICANWFLQIFSILILLMHGQIRLPQQFESFRLGMQIYILPSSLLLALAWKGLPRLHVATAAIFMWALIASTVIG